MKIKFIKKKIYKKKIIFIINKNNILNIEKISFKKIPIWIVVLIVIFNLIITVQFGYLVTKSKTALEIAQITNKGC